MAKICTNFFAQNTPTGVTSTIFVNLCAFLLQGVIVTSSDGAYDPAMRQAALDRLSRRCETCGHYDCTCSSGGGYTTRSKSRDTYDYVGDECCDYSGGSGEYVVVKKAPAKRIKHASGEDCYEYSGEVSSRGKGRGGGRVEYSGEVSSRGKGKGGGRVEYSGEHEYRTGRAGGYYEEEYGKGSYRGGREYKSEPEPCPPPPPKKRGPGKKRKGPKDC